MSKHGRRSNPPQESKTKALVGKSTAHAKTISKPAIPVHMTSPLNDVSFLVDLMTFARSFPKTSLPFLGAMYPTDDLKSAAVNINTVWFGSPEWLKLRVPLPKSDPDFDYLATKFPETLTDSNKKLEYWFGLESYAWADVQQTHKDYMTYRRMSATVQFTSTVPALTPSYVCARVATLAKNSLIGPVELMELLHLFVWLLEEWNNMSPERAQRYTPTLDHALSLLLPILVNPLYFESRDYGAIRLFTMAFLAFGFRHRDDRHWHPLAWSHRYHVAFQTFLINVLRLIHQGCTQGSTRYLWQATHCLWLIHLLFNFQGVDFYHCVCRKPVKSQHDDDDDEVVIQEEHLVKQGRQTCQTWIYTSHFLVDLLVRMRNSSNFQGDEQGRDIFSRVLSPLQALTKSLLYPGSLPKYSRPSYLGLFTSLDKTNTLLVVDGPSCIEEDDEEDGTDEDTKLPMTTEMAPRWLLVFPSWLRRWRKEAIHDQRLQLFLQSSIGQSGLTVAAVVDFLLVSSSFLKCLALELKFVDLGDQAVCIPLTRSKSAPTEAYDYTKWSDLDPQSLWRGFFLPYLALLQMAATTPLTSQFLPSLYVLQMQCAIWFKADSIREEYKDTRRIPACIDSLQVHHHVDDIDETPPHEEEKTEKQPVVERSLMTQTSSCSSTELLASSQVYSQSPDEEVAPVITSITITAPSPTGPKPMTPRPVTPTPTSRILSPRSPARSLQIVTSPQARSPSATSRSPSGTSRPPLTPVSRQNRLVTPSGERKSHSPSRDSVVERKASPIPRPLTPTRSQSPELSDSSFSHPSDPTTADILGDSKRNPPLPPSPKDRNISTTSMCSCSSGGGGSGEDFKDTQVDTQIDTQVDDTQASVIMSYSADDVKVPLFNVNAGSLISSTPGESSDVAPRLIRTPSILEASVTLTSLSASPQAQKKRSRSPSPSVAVVDSEKAVAQKKRSRSASPSIALVDSAKVVERSPEKKAKKKGDQDGEDEEDEKDEDDEQEKRLKKQQADPPLTRSRAQAARRRNRSQAKADDEPLRPKRAGSQRPTQKSRNASTTPRSSSQKSSRRRK